MTRLLKHVDPNRLPGRFTRAYAAFSQHARRPSDPDRAAHIALAERSLPWYKGTMEAARSTEQYLREQAISRSKATP